MVLGVHDDYDLLILAILLNGILSSILVVIHHHLELSSCRSGDSPVEIDRTGYDQAVKVSSAQVNTHFRTTCLFRGGATEWA